MICEDVPSSSLKSLWPVIRPVSVLILTSLGFMVPVVLTLPPSCRPPMSTIDELVANCCQPARCKTRLQLQYKVQGWQFQQSLQGADRCAFHAATMQKQGLNWNYTLLSVILEILPFFTIFLLPETTTHFSSLWARLDEISTPLCPQRM